MENKFFNLNFCKQWGVVLSIIFRPGFFLSVVVTGVSLYLSIFYKNNIPFSNTMAIIGSIFGGIAGAFLKDEYDKKSGKNILEKKGLSALRNLKGISIQLSNIKLWVANFSKGYKKKEDKRILEEINRHIATIELNINSGLEDWVDIVPELKEKSQQEAELVKRYKDAAQSVMVELLEKRKELAVAKDETMEKELRKKINNLEGQIKEIRKERSQAVNNVGFSILGSNDSAGVLKSSDGIYLSNLGMDICDKCGKRFNKNYLATSSIYLGGGNYCDDCKREIDGTSINHI